MAAIDVQVGQSFRRLGRKWAGAAMDNEVFNPTE